jgi:hypothetical protein
MHRLLPWLLVILLSCSSLWLFVQFFQASENLTECVVHEGLAHEERDFLMFLPKILREAPERPQLISALRNAQPGAFVGEVGGNICVGRLLLVFDGVGNQVVDIREGCD